MHAANAETNTQVADVQNNGYLYSLDSTPINL